ncbi:MAG: hypothetical protein KKB51_05180 [Candidatus Riflebacteria bacterium]|nr:hypothetical protein [Candidatus Riflebacteria bacterium]
MICSCKKSDRKGFILYLVCALALCLMILAASLNRFKAGAVLQLAKTIDQEKMIVVATAAINEMLAGIKENINNPATPAGKCVYDFWKKSIKAVPNQLTLWKSSYAEGQLSIANQMATEYLGPSGSVSGEASLVIRETIGPGMPSYIGLVQLVARVQTEGLQSEVTVKEHRDLKIVDLSDPFLDKYALFVKSFCKSLNDPNVRLIVNGISDPVKYSFIYLGNRAYPACLEFPSGSMGAQTPPVLLDLDFLGDRKLLGGFYQPGGFQAKNKECSQASINKLFWVKKPALNFKPFADKFSVSSDFHRVPELADLYKGLIESCKPAADNQSSVVYPIMKEHNRVGGRLENSKVFHSLLKDCFETWQYHYGYSDYSNVVPVNKDSLTQNNPLSGIMSYFEHIKNLNPQRLAGGKMPALFGENRNICAFIEGPVYLRFFKLAFLDTCSIKFSLFAGMSSNIDFPAIPMRYEAKAFTFSGKSVGQIDKMTDKLMSHPVEHMSINNFFFGSRANSEVPTTAGKTKIQGYEVFPIFDPSLTTTSHFYLTTGEFLKSRLKTIDGQKVLDLDGISMIAGTDGESLDLSTITKYRGKGMVIVFRGNCMLGNLAPSSVKENSLKLYLMSGRFIVTTSGQKATIQASLVATKYFQNNAQADPAQEGGFLANGKDVHIIGNLVVDNLLEMSNCKYLKITHDPQLFFPEYPVRVSIGQVKSFFTLDYTGKDK